MSVELRTNAQPDAASARHGVSMPLCRLGVLLTLRLFTGSKDRLDRAKTIDLCQNPLTVHCICTLS